jgi:hypothetical protein
MDWQEAEGILQRWYDTFCAHPHPPAVDLDAETAGLLVAACVVTGHPYYSEHQGEVLHVMAGQHIIGGPITIPHLADLAK